MLLSPTPAPSPSAPEGGPSSVRCSSARQHLPGPGCIRTPRMVPGTPREAVPAPLVCIEKPYGREGGTEQQCCHGGKEAAERETFPRREESAGDEGRGLPGSLRPRGINLCKVWRWRGYICLWIDGVGGRKTPPLSIPVDGELPDSPSPTPLCAPRLELGHPQRPPLAQAWFGLQKSQPGPSERCSSLPLGLLLPPPARPRWLTLLCANNPINPPLLLLPPTLRVNKPAQERQETGGGLDLKEKKRRNLFTPRKSSPIAAGEGSRPHLLAEGGREREEGKE